MPIAGLTTEAIATRLKASIKVLNNPPVVVRVRDYSSHTVSVIGFVNIPGAKVLRRDAVPLYVVLAEAIPLAEAASATIVRNGRNAVVVDLKDTKATGYLVLAGDAIKVSGAAAGPSEFFYAGGEVKLLDRSHIMPE